jgi:hypothetical protein
MSIISGGGAVVGAGAAGGYQIERSLRFNSADSAYLNRTPGSAGNRKVMTWNLWLKKSSIASANKYLFACNDEYIRFNDTITDTLRVKVASSNLITTQLFRDPAAWGMLTIAVDTTQATASNRVKVYWNSVQITAFGTETYPSQNADATFNTADLHRIGSYAPTAEGFYDGYLTEINFIDGSALDPTSFGEFNSDTGVWQPKAYTGSYGAQGWFLNFSDNTSTTTLGDDLSGNGNDWSTSGFSVTAGAGNDSLVDTPTPYGTDTGAGGQVRGNYTTWNALDRNSSGTLANGNLDWTSGTTAHYGVRGTMSPPSGKWYFEVTASAATSGSIAYGIGMANAANPLNVGAQSNTGAYILYGTSSSMELEAAGVQGSTISGGASIGTNDVIQVAYDVDASKMWVGKNNTYYDSSGGSTGDPGTGANPSFSSLLANLFPFVEVYNSTVFANFGQRPFSYTAPSGFKALCTQNLPEPTIVDGGEYFNTVLYTGNGSVGRSVTGVGFQPDFTWIKGRSDADYNYLVDIIRTYPNRLFSNLSDAASTESNTVTSSDSDGFTVGSDAGVNRNTSTYVAWNWKANGAGVSNTDGTITSTVSANTDSGFSIVTYTGTGVAATIGHGLGTKPSFFIIKKRTNSGTEYGWYCYSSVLGATNHLVLNTTAGSSSSSFLFDDTEPSSSAPYVFTVGTSPATNEISIDYVAYCFAAIPAYSAMGSFLGNGSADGPFVYTGFKPAFVLVKNSSAAWNWIIWDSERNTYNQADNVLQPNNSDAEYISSSFMSIDILSNGFKLRTSDSQENGSGNTLIYAAFAENPFKYALAR